MEANDQPQDQAEVSEPAQKCNNLNMSKHYRQESVRERLTAMIKDPASNNAKLGREKKIFHI